jgi:hypothetical protein
LSLAAGTKLGPYEVVAPIGAGGMGEVYKARDTRLNRTVAVKVLPSHLSSSADVRQRFEREAQTISQFSHPHICALYDVGREGETEYLRQNRNDAAAGRRLPGATRVGSFDMAADGASGSTAPAKWRVPASRCSSTGSPTCRADSA